MGRYFEHVAFQVGVASNFFPYVSEVLQISKLL